MSSTLKMAHDYMIRKGGYAKLFPVTGGLLALLSSAIKPLSKHLVLVPCEAFNARWQKGKKCKAESNVQQSRVGQDALFNFMKKERHEMRKVANAKLDSKMQEEIAKKWRKLNLKEKATYGSALEGLTGQVEGSSGQVNDIVNEMGFTSRYSPDRFHRTVEKLSNEKQLAINATGFGIVSSLSCTRLHRKLCQFFIQRFNPDTSSIELHGKVFGISAVEFGRVMGLKNTDEDVELDSPVEDEKVKQLVKSFSGNGKRVLVRSLAEQLEKCENADEDFKVRFVMFALGTVLCPTSSPSVIGSYLTFLTIPGKIETKNWANHGFKFLYEGVRSFKAKKALDPIVSWDNQSVWKMIKWVRKQGGFESPTVRVVSKHRPTNEVSRVNLERIVQEVSMSLAPVIQAEVKRSIEGLALGPIIQAEFQRSMLELTDKEDGPLKIQDEGGENVVKNMGEESSKLKEKGAVDEQVNNTSDGKLFELGAKLRRENSNRFTVGLKKCEKVEIWDSLSGSQYNAGRYQLAEKIMKALDYIYNDEIVKYFQKGWQFAKFNIVRSDKARRQLNGCDCGIFVMNWLENIECKSHGSNKVSRHIHRFILVDKELDKFTELGPFILHHPIARKPMTRSQAK
ncbi:unnamed protein product [Prunus brigantina]